MQTLEQLKNLMVKKFYENVVSREKLFREFVEELCRSRLVEEVYLVGSRARGDNIPSSDFDIIIVVNNNMDLIETLERVYKLKKHPIPIDIIALHSEDLNDPLYKEMLKDRKRLC
ncbi:MAG: nucleotidyltransferase domain-containing protein [Infirmifilum sp.]